MGDYVFVCWRSKEQTVAELGQALLALKGAMLALGAERLVLNPSDGPPAPIERPRPDGSMIAATLTATLPSDERAEALATQLAAACAFVAAYAVKAEVPLDYERNWADGVRSPGVKQISFFVRKPGMGKQAFIDYWHGIHTPLAIEIHPLWRYLRCVVDRALTAGAPPYEGIVELHFRALEDITDPLRFYGGKQANMGRIASDVQNFIDLSKIEITQASELILESRGRR